MKPFSRLFAKYFLKTMSSSPDLPYNWPNAGSVPVVKGIVWLYCRRGGSELTSFASNMSSKQ